MSGSQRIEIPAGSPGQAMFVSGQAVPALFDSLVSESERRSSLADTTVFAEPVFGEQPGRIDWYVDNAAGEYVPWPELADEEKEVARRNLQQAVESLRGLKNGADPSFDRLVDAALQVPNETDILVSDGLPRLVRWGMTEDGRIPEVSIIDRVLGEAEQESAPVAAPPSANLNSASGGSITRENAVSPLLLSMTLTILAMAISGLLMLQNCGLAIPKFLTGGRTIFIANFCPVVNSFYNPDAELLARLERDIQNSIGSCDKGQAQPANEDEEGVVTTPEFEEAVKSGVVEKVMLRIYDNTSEDGDVVTVTAPGYSRTITLTNEGATFEIPLVRGEMKLYGEEDGGGGITVSVALTDGTHIVDGSMKEGEQISLTIPN